MKSTLETTVRLQDCIELVRRGELFYALHIFASFSHGFQFGLKILKTLPENKKLYLIDCITFSILSCVYSMIDLTRKKNRISGKRLEAVHYARKFLANLSKDQWSEQVVKVTDYVLLLNQIAHFYTYMY